MKVKAGTYSCGAGRIVRCFAPLRCRGWCPPKLPSHRSCKTSMRYSFRRNDPSIVSGCQALRCSMRPSDQLSFPAWPVSGSPFRRVEHGFPGPRRADQQFTAAFSGRSRSAFSGACRSRRIGGFGRLAWGLGFRAVSFRGPGARRSSIRSGSGPVGVLARSMRETTM